MNFKSSIVFHPRDRFTQYRVWLIFIGLIILNLAIHFPFLLINSFGEQDAARLANNSLIASSRKNGPIYFNNEPVYSAPLYSEVLRISAKLGIINPANIIGWMAIVSFLASAVVTGMLYIFVLKLNGSVWVALGACLMLQLNPAFWNNSIYGFPSIIAIAFMLISLVMFQTALNMGEVPNKIALLLGVFVFFILAVTTKIDTLLIGAIFCLPIWLSNLNKRKKIIYTGIVFGVILGSLYLYTQFTKDLLINQQVSTYFDQWNSKFPIDLGYLFSNENIRIIVTATGLLCLPIALVSFFLLIRDQKYIPIIFWLVLSSIPIVLFWGLRVGNSARHNLYPIIFLVVLLALPLGTHYRKIWGVVLIVMCLINYFVLAPSSSTIKPSGQLVTSSKLIAERISGIKNEARSIAGLAEEKIAIVGNGPSQPYFQFELFRRYGLNNINVGFELQPNYSKIEYINDDQKQTYLWIYSIPSTAELAQLVDLGYIILLFDKTIIEELSGMTNLKNHLLSINQVMQ